MSELSNYLICATARGGSNLLCELLASLGFAGKPFEHLWPYRLTYEELDPAPREAVGELLRFLGHEGPLPRSLAVSRHQRQADEVSESWVRRYTWEVHEERF